MIVKRIPCEINTVEKIDKETKKNNLEVKTKSWVDVKSKIDKRK